MASRCGASRPALRLKPRCRFGKAPGSPCALWVRATAVFGVVQTAVAFALAPIFAATGESYAVVFASGLGSSLAALAAAVFLAKPR